MIIQPVILSGGSGSRLWPLSREFYPKQLLAPCGDSTLLQATVDRLSGLDQREYVGSPVKVAAPVIVCNEAHRFLVAEQLRQAQQQHDKIILESVGRNTAPAATLAALRIAETDPETVLLIMPADHLIQDAGAFHDAVLSGGELALHGGVVTFGIVPDRPETGYGYIRKGAAVPGSAEPVPHILEQFVEKPDAETAERYLDAGEYLWNSGIFMMQAQIWLDNIGNYRPDILSACQEAYSRGAEDGDFYRVDKVSFESCPSDSIDYAVMEKLVASSNPGQAESSSRSMACVIPLVAGWSD